MAMAIASYKPVAGDNRDGPGTWKSLLRDGGTENLTKSAIGKGYLNRGGG